MYSAAVSASAPSHHPPCPPLLWPQFCSPGCSWKCREQPGWSASANDPSLSHSGSSSHSGARIQAAIFRTAAPAVPGGPLRAGSQANGPLCDRVLVSPARPAVPRHKGAQAAILAESASLKACTSGFTLPVTWVTREPPTRLPVRGKGWRWQGAGSSSTRCPPRTRRSKRTPVRSPGDSKALTSLEAAGAPLGAVSADQ